MRILLWSSLYDPSIGGVERYSARLVKGLTRAGCAVEVITNTMAGSPNESTVSGTRVTRLPFPASIHGDLTAIRTVRDGLRQIMDRLQPDLLNLQTSGPSVVHYQLHRRALPLPLVTTFHGIYPASSEMRAQLLPVFEMGSATIATSHATKSSLVEMLGDAAGTIRVHLPPLDDERRPPRGAPHGAMVIGVGRHVVDKGWETLLRAMPLVRAAVPSAQLVLVGDGPDRQRLEQIVATDGLTGAVRFTGIVDDEELRDWFDLCDVLCMPSLDEGFGMVAIEASSRARPVVASRVGGLLEAVVDGGTGLLVPPADPSALAGALIKILTNDELAAQLGRSGREHSQQFAIERIAAATLDTFRAAAKS